MYPPTCLPSKLAKRAKSLQQLIKMIKLAKLAQQNFRLVFQYTCISLKNCVLQKTIQPQSKNRVCASSTSSQKDCVHIPLNSIALPPFAARFGVAFFLFCFFKVESCVSKRVITPNHCLSIPQTFSAPWGVYSLCYQVCSVLS